MRIQLVASDSMGVRSMCAYVETDIKLLIDPSVSLAPSRYNLPPHDLELEEMEKAWRRILSLSEKAEVIAITHYHFDHFSWNYPEQFRDKVLLIKHPKQRINRSQFGRAAYFLEVIEDIPERIEYSDGKEFSFGETLLRFSSPVCHGTNPKLGYVTQLLVGYKEESFLFTSDLEGPALKDQQEFILSQKPSVIYLDGPMTYMLGYRYAQASFEASKQHMRQILSEVKPKSFVLDHHLLRDLRWKEKLWDVFEEAERHGTKVETAAEFMGERPKLLEALRKELYEGFVP